MISKEKEEKIQARLSRAAKHEEDFRKALASGSEEMARQHKNKCNTLFKGAMHEETGIPLSKIPDLVMG